MYRYCLYVALIVLLSGCGGGGSDAGKAPSPGFKGTVYNDIASGDFDNDGYTDIAAVVIEQDGDKNTRDPIYLYVMLQESANPGYFTIGQKISLQHRLTTLLAHDVSNDGWVDLIATEPGAGLVTIYLRDGVSSGQFRQSDQRSFERRLTRTLAADVDLDGLPDLVVGTERGVMALVQDNNTIGTFPERIVIEDSVRSGNMPSFEQQSLAVGDLNSDGAVDIVTLRTYSQDSESMPSTNTIYFYLHDPAIPGQFSRAKKLSMSVEYLDAVTIADINLDGFQDISAAGGEPFSGYTIVSTRRQIPTLPGEFLGSHREKTKEGLGYAIRLAISDLNNDTLPDIVLARLPHEEPGTVAVFTQSESSFDFHWSGHYEALTLKGLTPYLRGFAVADFNNDGLPDVALADGELSCLFNNPANPGIFHAARQVLN